MRLSVRLVAAVATSSFALVSPVIAQSTSGAALTPYAGFLVTGAMFDGPLGTNIGTTNSPMLGVQGSVPIVNHVAVVGNLAYASGDLRVGLPILGGVNVGSAKTWLYDAGLEIGGMSSTRRGAAPFVQGGVGGMTTDISNSLLNVRSSSIAYTAAAGIDLGLSRNIGVRLQAKDWIGRFDSEAAIGFKVNGNMTHNWALSAGVRVGF